ncbi:MAG: enoyl-CoA hydratase/isomerase family protein [Spirochaetes bacterium]|nr:enoyl-CoA hydratase/isomerase family protein [Spirochaetota bacterium]
MAELSVLKEINSYVTRIILNNPENGNAVNNDNLPLIHQYLQEAIASSECRVIVIEGKEGIFCRGMDFKFLMNSGQENQDWNIGESFSQPYRDVVTTIYQSPKPVIAKVEGQVLAGGMGIALACDIIIAAESSTFGLSEVLFGIIPAYVFPFLLDRISYKKARFLVLSSKTIAADHAYQMGMVDELVPDDKINRVLKDYLKRLLYSSPAALALTKEYSNRLTANEIEKKIDIAQKQLTDLLNNPENINTIRNFLEGEKPKWAVKYSSKG